MMRSSWMALSLAVMLGAVFSARAQAETPAEAFAHNKAGVKAYRLGDFRRSIDEFTKSYELDPAPVVLFNIAQAHAQLGDVGKAIFFYEQYLADAPRSAEFRRVAEQRLQELRRLARKSGTKTAPSVTQCVPPVPMDTQFASISAAGALPPNSRTNSSEKPNEGSALPPHAATPSARADHRAPAATPAAAPAGWSHLRLTLTITTAALGLAAVGAGIGLLVGADKMANQLEEILPSAFKLPVGVDIGISDIRDLQQGAIVAFSLGAGFLIASTVAAMWPRIPDVRRNGVVVRLLPAVDGVFVQGTF